MLKALTYALHTLKGPVAVLYSFFRNPVLLPGSGFCSDQCAEVQRPAFTWPLTLGRSCASARWSRGGDPRTGHRHRRAPGGPSASPWLRRPIQCPLHRIHPPRLQAASCRHSGRRFSLCGVWCAQRRLGLCGAHLSIYGLEIAPQIPTSHSPDAAHARRASCTLGAASPPLCIHDRVLCCVC